MSDHDQPMTPPQRPYDWRYQRLYESLMDAFVGTDMAGRIFETNGVYQDLVGYSQAELQALTWRDLTPEKWWAIEQRIVDEQVLVRGYSDVYEKEYRHKSGRVFPVELRRFLNRDERGQAVGMSAIVRDITARKRTEALLRRTQTAVDHAREAIFWLQEDGRFVYVNDAACRSLGYTREELLACTVFDIDPQFPRANWAAHWRHTRDVGWSLIETLHQSKDGRVFPVEVAIDVVHFDGAVFHCAYVRDISERKQAEAERQAQVHFLESTARVEQAIRGAADLDQVMTRVLDCVLGIFGCDRAWLLSPCVPEAPEWHVPMERTVPEYPGAWSRGIVLPWDAEIAEALRVTLAANGPACFGPDGMPVPPSTAQGFGVRSQVVLALHPKIGPPWAFGLHQCSYVRTWSTADLRLFGAIGARLADALTSLLTLRDLRESERRFRTLVEHAADAFMLITPEGRICDVNQLACDSLGYTRDELVGRNIAEIDVEVISGRHKQRYWDSLAPGQTVTFEGRHRRRDGSTFPVEVRMIRLEIGGQWFLAGLARDISERKRAEEEQARLEAQLRQVQKIEAIGQLAGGVAHDFNNILTAILGNVELALGELETTTPTAHGVREGLQQIQTSAERAARLTRQLLTFGRRQIVHPQMLDLNQAVRGLEKMLRRLITENIRLTLTLANDLPPLEADAGQIEQVVINLVVNARDAMPQGGVLTLQTQRAELDETYVATHAEARSGEHAALVVSDTGHGMDASTLERIFEPFFTTKAAGQGTGLGLATVYGIVKQAGGHVVVESKVGRGTTFRVLLPSARKAAAPAAAPPPRQSAISRGTETILLCEDDPAVRALTSGILRDAGYTVLATAHGAAALQAASEHDGPIALLVTDVIMPGMNGRRLADALSLQRPGLRTLFVSGYSANIIAEHGVLETDVAFLEKPFTRQSLLTRVRQILDEPASATPPPECASA